MAISAIYQMSHFRVEREGSYLHTVNWILGKISCAVRIDKIIRIKEHTGKLIRKNLKNPMKWTSYYIIQYIFRQISAFIYLFPVIRDNKGLGVSPCGLYGVGVSATFRQSYAFQK